MITITLNYNSDTLEIDNLGIKLKIKNIHELRLVLIEVINALYDNNDRALTLEKIDEDTRTIIEEW